MTHRIYPTRTYKKSLQKLYRAGKLPRKMVAKLEFAIELLATGRKLPQEFRDHKLKGIFSEYREFHIKGDLLVIYQIDKSQLVLLLVDIGTHADLFN